MASTENFVTAIKLRDQLDLIISRNSDALLMADVDGQDHVVIDGFIDELDSDGDARFTLRSYGEAKKARITDIEKKARITDIEETYQND